MVQIVTTNSVEARQRHAYWVDMVCKAFVQIECEVDDRVDFSGLIVDHPLPGLNVTVATSGAQNIVRSSRDIARDSSDYFFASLQVRGRTAMAQDGREVLLSPGDISFYDSTRPYLLHFLGDFKRIVVKLPGEQVRSLTRNTEALTATALCGHTGAGHLFTVMTHTLIGAAAKLQPGAAVAATSAMTTLLVAGLHSLPAAQTSELPSLSAYHLARIKHCIDSRLREPTLTIESVAAQLQMSVGHLHRLFKTEAQSPSRYLWNRRLDSCSHELLDPRHANMAVAQIAYSWGFNDRAHFSRAFRQRFKCSPSEWRLKAQVVTATESDSKPRVH
jgi:AraC-like DNA-binding protein